MKTWLEAGLSFFYPPACQLCGCEPATPAEGFVGARCWQNVRFIRPPFCDRCGQPFEGDVTTRFECGNCREMDLRFASARAAAVSTPWLLDIIHRYKYQRATWFEPFLVDLLLREIRPALPGSGWQRIIPVPLHPLKQREREFNQAARLARRLGRATGIPVDCSLLRRILPTRTQTMLDRRQRAANVRKAFAPGPGAVLHGEPVLLIDDVLTTGATTSACAAVLRDCGSGPVSVWTVARGVR